MKKYDEEKRCGRCLLEYSEINLCYRVKEVLGITLSMKKDT